MNLSREDLEALKQYFEILAAIECEMKDEDV